MNEQDIKKEKTNWYLMGKTKGVKEGTHKVVLEGTDPAFKKADTVDGDTFFEVPINVTDKVITINGKKLLADGKEITMNFTVNGEVH